MFCKLQILCIANETVYTYNGQIFCMKKIVIIGANGQLGTDLMTILNTTSYELLPLTHKDIEITKKESIKTVCDSFHPDMIINTAAYTRVDDAETDPQTCFSINALGTKNLVEYCKDKNIPFVLYSTDYIFGQDTSRKTPYKETDFPGPVNTYGISKLSGEEYVKGYLSKYYIIRTTGLFGIAGSSGKGYNFVELMLSLAKQGKQISVVSDQISSPTYTKQLAEQSLKIFKSNQYGIYHVTSNGSCSWYEFAKEIFKLTRQRVDILPVTKKTWITPARRPHYSVLSNGKIKKLGNSKMTNWKTALKEYMKEKGHI